MVMDLFVVGARKIAAAVEAFHSPKKTAGLASRFFEWAVLVADLAHEDWPAASTMSARIIPGSALKAVD